MAKYDDLFEDVPYQEPVRANPEMVEDLFDDVEYGTESKDSKYSETGSALKGAQQGATFGFADEIGAGLESGMDSVQALLNKIGIADESPSQAADRMQREGFSGDLPAGSDNFYDTALQDSRAEYAKAEADNPKSFLAGDLAGGILAPVPGMGAAAGGLKTALKGAKVAGKAGKALAKGGQATKALTGEVAEQGGKLLTKEGVKSAGKAGAMMGALEGAGRSEGDAMDVAMGTVLGGTLGGVLGAGMGKLGKKGNIKAMEELAEQAPLDANTAALKSIGATGKDFAKELGTKTNKRATAKTAKGTGQTLIDEGILKTKQTAAEVKERIVKKVNEVVKERMNPVIQKLDNKTAEKLSQKDYVDPLNGYINSVKRTFENRVGSTSYAENASKQLYRQMINRSETIYNDVVQAVKSPDTFTQLKQIKMRLQKEINFDNPDASTYNQFLLDTMGNVSRLMNDIAKKVDPELAIDMTKANHTYSNLIRANEVAGKELVRDMGKAGGLDWRDYATAAVASGVSGIQSLGPLAVAGKKGLEKFTGKDTGKLMNTMEAFVKNRQAKAAREALEEIPNSPFKRAMQGQSANLTQAATGGAAAILDDNQSREPYKMKKLTADYVKKATPEELLKQAEVIKSKYGKSGERLAATLEKLSQMPETSRIPLTFSLLDSYENRKMLGLAESGDE